MDVIHLEGIENVRDLGGIPVGCDRAVAQGIIYRGSAVVHPSPADIERFFYGKAIRSIIDLRCGWERKEAPDAAIGGIENLHIPYFDKDLVGVEYVKPAPGTIMTGHDFACVPEDFYRALANELTVAQMKRVVHETLSRASRGEAVYIHCSGGKDRAGVTALLILEVLGASRESILEDYLRTNISRDAHIQHIYERFLRLCGNEETAWQITRAHRAKPENLAVFYEQINQRYHGMDAFIAHELGIDDEKRAAWVRACTVPS